MKTPTTELVKQLLETIKMDSVYGIREIERPEVWRHSIEQVCTDFLEMKKALEKVDKIGLTHYEDCETMDTDEKECDCGIESLEILIKETLAKLEGGK